jgi:hypothetical protein
MDEGEGKVMSEEIVVVKAAAGTTSFPNETSARVYRCQTCKSETPGSSTNILGMVARLWCPVCAKQRQWVCVEAQRLICIGLAENRSMIWQKPEDAAVSILLSLPTDSLMRALERVANGLNPCSLDLESMCEIPVPSMPKRQIDLPTAN